MNLESHLRKYESTYRNVNFYRILHASLNENSRIVSVGDKVGFPDGSFNIYKRYHLSDGSSFEKTISLVTEAASKYVNRQVDAIENINNLKDPLPVIKEEFKAIELFYQFNEKIQKIVKIYQDRANPSEADDLKKIFHTNEAFKQMHIELKIKSQEKLQSILSTSPSPQPKQVPRAPDRSDRGRRRRGRGRRL